MISGMFKWWYLSGDITIFYAYLTLYIGIVSFLTYMRLFNNELEDKIINPGDDVYNVFFVICFFLAPGFLLMAYVISPIVVLLIPVSIIVLALAKLIDLSVKTVKKNRGKSFEEINEAYEKLLKEIEELKNMDKKDG